MLRVLKSNTNCHIHISGSPQGHGENPQNFENHGFHSSEVTYNMRLLWLTCMDYNIPYISQSHIYLFLLFPQPPAVWGNIVQGVVT